MTAISKEAFEVPWYHSRSGGKPALYYYTIERAVKLSVLFYTYLALVAVSAKSIKYFIWVLV